jgi:flagellar biosynthesis anti-sigma factor FlgM
MKIDHRVLHAYQRTGGVSGVSGKPPASAPAPVSSHEASGAGEATKVTISPEARALAKASPDFDPAKVDALKQKVDRGEYKVDSQAVARRLLDKLA